MACEDVRAALTGFDACVETEQGSRVTTHCLYPSFDPVHVFVARLGDGFRVHDGGGAVKSAWMHGRHDSLIRKVLSRQAIKYQIVVDGNCLVANIPNRDWLCSAIMAVANASASAAHIALDRMVSATERVLKDRILDVLRSTITHSEIKTEYTATGKSGKVHHFDFAVQEPDNSLLLISAVAPHHISVSAKYVAFSDVLHRTDGRIDRFAVHDRELDESDISLLLQVAEIVPITSLKKGVQMLMHGTRRG